MASRTFDFSKLNDSAGLIPGGDYVVELKRTKDVVAQTGTPGIMFVFEVAEPEEFQGRTLFLTVYITQASLWRLKQVLEGFGCYSEEELKSPDFQFDPAELIGMRLLAQVTQAPDNRGNMRNNINKTLPLTTGGGDFEYDAGNGAYEFTGGTESVESPYTTEAVPHHIEDAAQLPLVNYGEENMADLSEFAEVPEPEFMQPEATPVATKGKGKKN